VVVLCIEFLHKKGALPNQGLLSIAVVVLIGGCSGLRRRSQDESLKKTKDPFQTRGHFLSLLLAVAVTLNVVVVVKTNLSKKTKGPFQTRGNFLSLSLAAAALDFVVVVKTNHSTHKKRVPSKPGATFY